MVGLVLFWVLMGLVGWKIGERKGRPVLGFVLGIVLGLIGIVIIALLPRKARHVRYAPASPGVVGFRCPSCGADVLPAANTCHSCRQALQPTALIPPPDGTRAGWLRDPSGRFVDRYWDGFGWTEWVRNEPNTEFLTDPPVPARGVGTGPSAN